MFSKILSIFLIYLSVFSCLVPGAGIKIAVHAAYAPNQQTLTVGQETFIDLINLKVLTCRVSSNVVNTTCRTMNGTSGYLPSGSKNFRIHAVRCMNSSATANSAGQFFYNDNDTGIDNAGGTANVITPGGFSVAFAAPSMFPCVSSGGGYGYGEKSWGYDGFLVPNGKYTGIVAIAAGSIWVEMFGYEE